MERTALQIDRAAPVFWADCTVLSSMVPPCGELLVFTSSWVGRGGLAQLLRVSSNSCLWCNLTKMSPPNTLLNIFIKWITQKFSWALIKSEWIPLLAQDLLQFCILSCLESCRWCQRANISQVVNQLTMLTWSVWTSFPVTVQPLCFQTAILTVIQYIWKCNPFISTNATSLTLHDKLVSVEINTPFFLWHNITIQDL